MSRFGTVQIDLATPRPNLIAATLRSLVRRSARRRGIAARLMEAVEREALAEGKTLLVLDTVTGDAAERLYERLAGRSRRYPDYALYRDGRPCATTVFYSSLDGAASPASTTAALRPHRSAEGVGGPGPSTATRAVPARSVLRFGGIFFVLFGIALFVVIWLAASGRWPVAAR